MNTSSLNNNLLHLLQSWRLTRRSPHSLKGCQCSHKLHKVMEPERNNWICRTVCLISTVNRVCPAFLSATNERSILPGDIQSLLHTGEQGKARDWSLNYPICRSRGGTWISFNWYTVSLSKCSYLDRGLIINPHCDPWQTAVFISNQFAQMNQRRRRKQYGESGGFVFILHSTFCSSVTYEYSKCHAFVSRFS